MIVIKGPQGIALVIVQASMVRPRVIIYNCGFLSLCASKCVMYVRTSAYPEQPSSNFMAQEDEDGRPG